MPITYTTHVCTALKTQDKLHTMIEKKSIAFDKISSSLILVAISTSIDHAMIYLRDKNIILLCDTFVYIYLYNIDNFKN